MPLFIKNPVLAKQIAKRRWLRRLGWFKVPESAAVGNADRDFWVDLGDWQGPSYHVLNWGLDSYEVTNVGFLKSYLASCPKPRFLDIGANVGIFSFVLDRDVASLSTIAFEPEPVTFRCLQKTFVNRPRVQTVNLALSSHGGQSTLFSDASNHGGHSLHEKSILAEGDSVSGETTVNVCTLDQFLSETGSGVDAIKLDVQRHEGEVLAGAQETIRKHRPLFLMECYFDELLVPDSPLTRPFQGQAYDVMLIENGSRFALDGFDFAHLERNERGYRDFAFVPKEKIWEAR